MAVAERLDAARGFFERFFGLRCRYQRHKQIAILIEHRLRVCGEQPVDSPAPSYPPDFHVGFTLEHTREVRDIYERLKAAGVGMKLELGIQGPAFVFQCLGPDAIPVEVRAPKES